MDKDCSPNAQRLDLNIKEFEEERELFLANLRLDVDQRKKVTERIQCHSAEWLEERRKRICAFAIGKVCKRRPHTSCECSVRHLFMEVGPPQRQLNMEGYMKKLHGKQLKM